MEGPLRSVDHCKRKRRRREDRTPLRGWLQPVDHLKGNVGVASSDLFARLFQNISRSPDDVVSIDEVGYIAITPSSSPSQNLVSRAKWNLLPVRCQITKEEGALKRDGFSVQIPAKSLALQSCAQALRLNAAGKGKGRLGMEVGILEVQPIKLHTVCVDVDGDLLDKHDKVQKQFGGGFLSAQANGSTSKGKGKARANSHENEIPQAQAQTQDDQLIQVVREALVESMLVRQNDLLALPLPTHPITHVSFPPSKISLCEPVLQGLLSPTTRIVINRIRHLDPTKQRLPSVAANRAFRGVPTEDDTSNEQFYSAAEHDGNDARNDGALREDYLESENSDKESTSSSDEPLEEMISMKAPTMRNGAAGALSSRTAATPRLKKNGTSTPGSVFSNFTSTTARRIASGRPRTFQANGLMSKISDDLLHPKPARDEDDEARVYVDIKALLKLGCFSGDWVKIQATSRPQTFPSRLWGFETPSEDGVYEVFKPAKIYGLPNMQPMHPRRYSRAQPDQRRSSVITTDRVTPIAWLSPIILSNLGQPSSIDISTLPNPTPEDPVSAEKLRITAPPLARELTLLRIASPLSSERNLQAGLFSALKRHFETKRRILQRGDLIALSVDVSTSRLLSSATADGDADAEQLLNAVDTESSSTSLSIAWFKVGTILAQEENLPSGSWGGAATIESSTTRMRQVGSEQCRLPATVCSTWEYYLGVKPTMASTEDDHYITPPIKPYVTPVRRRLRELMAAATSPRAVHLGMDPVIACLHSTQRSIGKSMMTWQAAADLGLHVFEIDASDIIAGGADGGDVKTEGFLRGRIDRALTCGAPCTIILLRHIEALTADRIIAALKDIVKDVRMLVATTTEIQKVPDGFRSIFTHELEVVAPDEGDREGILQTLVQDRGLEHNVDLLSVSVKTAALVAGNLVDIVDRACVAKQERLKHLMTQAENNGALLRDLLISGGEFVRCLVKEDFSVAVEAARKNFADAAGAPKIPNVSWDDVGGLENVKEAVLETIQLPLERPELFAKGMKKRSGILFYGPPGTGKTLLAKAIATEFSLNFFSVKGPELLNMYIGESEANVRRVFQRARDARPCVVFFDELDSVAPKRGNQGDSGGVMDRIVSQLLAELDGMSDGEEGGGGVFVIGATNRPDLLDQALLRPGRFDKMLYLGISDTHEKQMTILEALTRKFSLGSDVSLQRVAQSLPFTYTGADLYALCSDAMLKAITRQTSAVDAKIKALPGGPVSTAYFFDHLATNEDIVVIVTEEDFHAAQRELVGSVS